MSTRAELLAKYNREATRPGARPRICAACKCEDRQLSFDIDVAARDQDHLVKPRLMYVDRAEDFDRIPKYLLKGWVLILWQGRLAIERMVCIPCLNNEEFQDSVYQDMKQQQSEAERAQKGDKSNFVLQMCEQDY